MTSKHFTDYIFTKSEEILSKIKKILEYGDCLSISDLQRLIELKSELQAYRATIKKSNNSKLKEWLLDKVLEVYSSSQSEAYVIMYREENNTFKHIYYIYLSMHN